MSLATDLLEQAQHLSQRESKRPRQASLRRSVSTAYYALFHLLTTEATSVFAPNISGGIAHEIQRWFNHGEMKSVCQVFRAATLSKPKTLHGLIPPADLKFVAVAFVSLQEARHSADYDLGSTWTRLDTQQLVQMARDAFAAWGRVRKTPEANVFILSLLLWKNFERDR